MVNFRHAIPVLGLLLSQAALAQAAGDPGEGDCSVAMIHDIRSAQRCSETGRCKASKPKVQVAAFLSCQPPWGNLMRLCFAEGCIDGKATVRRTVDGDEMVASIINNPKRYGGYPAKMATSLMVRGLDTPFPYQIVIFGGSPTPFTELAFGEFGAASFVGASIKPSAKARKALDVDRVKRYLGAPSVQEDLE